MHDFIGYQAARDRTEASAREALPDSPVRPPDPGRHAIRLRISVLLYRLADWLEPVPAKDPSHVGSANPGQPA